MPRRIPNSGKKKKERQQLKRAIKRGDLPPQEPTKKRPRKRRAVRIGPTGNIVDHQSSDAAVASARKLQSTFIKLPPRFLEDTKTIASTIPLKRPIPYDVALFQDSSADVLAAGLHALSCPKRPKWRFDMSKTEVEHNEEGVFKKWLTHADQLVEEWQKSREPETSNPGDTEDQHEPLLHAPPSPTYFERNLEVWRQLWRVTEISQIILVLLDSRCPLLHFPPSLVDYLAGRKVILVLTKADITGPVRVAAWMKYFSTHYPDFRVVQVESYIEKETTTVHQGRRRYEPHIPDTFRQRLIEAIKDVHSEMLRPPQGAANNAERSKTWVPPVKREIDWNGVLNASGGQVGSVVGGAAVPNTEHIAETDEKGSDGNKEPEILTVGLIGQPNVGKSSLLNALFGAQRVRVSKAPGKTKHFQTLFWTHDVRLVDCPGLVMPNYVPMEMQVLSGILPVSRMSAIPACVNCVSQLIPLERGYKLNHPSSSEPVMEDKRTWREGMQPPKPKPLQWTAMDVLIAYANAKGWVTAMAGRPDIHRAGNAIIRALAEGRLPWAFWPSDTALDIVSKESTGDDAGIWIPGRVSENGESGEESEERDGAESDDESELPSDEEDEEDDLPQAVTSIGRFGALQITDGEAEDEEGEEDESEDEDEEDEEDE